MALSRPGLLVVNAREKRLFMLIEVQRNTSSANSTIGKMYVDGQFECYTLEDVVRIAKIPGKTAIPAGRYAIVVDMSTRFHKRMPRLLNVPSFAGVRIHAGNTAADTEGCILVGRVKGVDRVGQSRLAYGVLFGKINKALRDGHTVTIDIKVATQLSHKAK